MGVRLAFIALLLIASVARAQPAIPELTEDERTALSFPIDPSSEMTRDNHFATLIKNVLSWGNVMPLWSARDKPAEELLPAEAFTGLGGVTFAEPGELFIFGGRFIRKEALEGRAGVERWVLNPYDPQTDRRASTPVVVYVSKVATGRSREPQSGWFVRVAARAYRQTTVVSPRGNTLPTHSFVGATFGVMPTPGGDASRYFSFIGIAISLVIAFGIVMAVVVTLVVRKGSKARAEAEE
jgi:hypothetical protein